MDAIFIMNLKEAIQTIESKELPASEAIQVLNEVTADGLCGWDIDACHNDKDVGYEWDVDRFYEELKETPF